MKLNNRKEVWVLADHRTGNVNQAIALAEELNFGYQLKQLNYNCLGILPNYLLSLRPINIRGNLLESWESEGLPDLIISSGRRTAAIASYLKRRSNNKTKIVQIMHPNLPLQQFDLIILPQHDKKTNNESNVLRIIGAINNVQAKVLAGGVELHKNYPELGEFIAVIIGGNSKNYSFTDENAHELTEILSNLVKDQLYSLFVSFSRRTPDRAKGIIKDNMPPSTIIYDPIIDETKPNPYFGMLAKSNYIISTADSISMCSEAASTGKPLYIFCPNNFKSHKHLSFIQQLIDLGLAKSLNKYVTNLEKYHYAPLSEVTRISEIVKSRLVL
jgi:mitochondrial fission protein ELM1